VFSVTVIAFYLRWVTPSRTRSRVILFTMSAVFTAVAWSDESPLYFDAQRVTLIDRYVSKSMSENSVPGAAVALIESGEIVFVKGYGIADQTGRPVLTQTPFQLASLTKSFTALLMLQLEEEGKLTLSDSVADFIPWFSTNTVGQASQITIRHLLQHNSGLSTAVGNLTQNSTYRGNDATERAVKKMLGTQLIAKPGTQFQYSNANYHIASHIIELVEQKPFELVMQERIFKPLGMKNSYVQISDNDTEKEALGFPHWFGYPRQRPFTLGRMKMGDGGALASIEDLAKYLIAVQQTAPDIMSPSIREKLLNHRRNNDVAYALGWEIFDYNGEPLFGHGGNNGGFTSWFGFTETSTSGNGVGLVILSNTSSALYDQFVDNVRRVALGREPLPTLNRVNLFFLLAQLVFILMLSFALYRTVFCYRPNAFRFTGFIMPTLLLIFAYINAYTVPALFNINLLSIYPFFPDLTVGLVAVALCSVMLALVKLFHLYRASVTGR